MKYIAEAHGGRIRVVSPIRDDGTGTAFVLSIPALARPAWPREAEELEAQATPKAFDGEAEGPQSDGSDIPSDPETGEEAAT